MNISPATKETVYALYYDRLRRAIEDRGTQNFPQANGQKLSKQNQAKAIDSAKASRNLWHGLAFLGQNPPLDLAHASTGELLDWAVAHWQRSAVTGLGHLYQEE